NANRTVVNVASQGHVSFKEVLAGRVSRFDASTHATLAGLPLESLELLASQRVSGKMSGDVDVALGTDVAPHLRAKLDATGVAVGRAHDNRIEVSLDADRDTLRADARIDQP